MPKPKLPTMKDFQDIPEGKEPEGGDFEGGAETPDLLEGLDLSTPAGQNAAVANLLPPVKEEPYKPPKPGKSIAQKMKGQIEAQNNDRFWLCIYARDEAALHQWLKNNGFGKWVGKRYVPLTVEDQA